MKCPFEVGDKVRHKASGKIGIVIGFGVRYKDDSHSVIGTIKSKEKNNGAFVYDGSVKISTCFGETTMIADCLVEHIKD